MTPTPTLTAAADRYRQLRANRQANDPHGPPSWAEDAAARTIADLIVDKPTDPVDDTCRHLYVSTACIHNRHSYCASDEGHDGAKVPARCKWGPGMCACGCHEEGTRTDG